tara:strand:+ start:324 stop:497 length:174 start_codon:yes stop_codon:yes gene_type:complete
MVETSMRIRNTSRRQTMTETLILVAIVGLGVAFVVELLPRGLTFLFEASRNVIAAPF